MKNKKNGSMDISLRKRLGLEIDRLIQNNYIAEHPLKQLFWECTLRCNLHCRHCGSDCKVVAGQQDMPVEDFLRVLDSVARKVDPHKVFVIVTGGEPLMRDDLERCGRLIYERGFPWGMVTNALRLTPERMQRLMEAGLHSMTISIDGLETNHNWMRGHKDSFRQAAQALELMAAQPLLVYDVVTCVNERNYPELPQLRDFLVGKGLKSWRLASIFPVGRAASDPELRLSPEHYRGLMEFILQTRREGIIDASYGCEGFLGGYEHEVRSHFYACQAGVTIGSVLADGSISACASIRADYHQGNIYEDDFMDVWERRFQPYRDRRWMRRDECASCSYFRYCRGNGMHLRDAEGRLLTCHLHRLKESV